MGGQSDVKLWTCHLRTWCRANRSRRVSAVGDATGRAKSRQILRKGGRYEERMVGGHAVMSQFMGPSSNWKTKRNNRYV